MPLLARPERVLEQEEELEVVRPAARDLHAAADLLRRQDRGHLAQEHGVVVVLQLPAEQRAAQHVEEHRARGPAPLGADRGLLVLAERLDELVEPLDRHRRAPAHARAPAARAASTAATVSANADGGDRDPVDAQLDQPGDERRALRRRVAAAAHGHARRVRAGDDERDRREDGLVLGAVARGEHRRVAVDAEHELRQVVRADREAVDLGGEPLGEERGRRHLGHRPELEARPLREALLGDDVLHRAQLVERPHERDADVDVVQPRVEDARRPPAARGAAPPAAPGTARRRAGRASGSPRSARSGRRRPATGTRSTSGRASGT